MFGIDSGELLLIAVIALVVIGPKDLPRAMRTLGHWAGRARGMARHFRSGLDTMMREAELEDMEKQWKAQNERIMREQPFASETDWGVAEPSATAPNLPESSAASSRPHASDRPAPLPPPDLAPARAPRRAPPVPPTSLP